MRKTNPSQRNTKLNGYMVPVLKTELDRHQLPHHFLSYGYGETVNVLVESDYLFTPSKNGHNVATFHGFQ